MKWLTKLAVAALVAAVAPAAFATKPAKPAKPKAPRVVAVPVPDDTITISPDAKGPVPDAWRAAVAAGLPPGQRLVQTLAGDLDGDGKPEWVAVGEPIDHAEGVSIAIFSAAEGKKAPALQFAQLLQERGLRVAGAQILQVNPIGRAVVLVGGEPSKAGDSRFVVDIYAWNGKAFRPMVPEIAEFRSQGGFSIEPGAAPYQGDELVVWTYRLGDDEQLYDRHVYEYKRWRWDGLRFKGESEESETKEKVADPEAARVAVGAKKPDLRRQMPRVAEVP